VTSTSAGAAFPFGTLGGPRFRFRAQAHAGTATAYRVTVRVRYKNTVNATLRVRVTPVGGSASTDSLSLPSTGGAWSFVSTTMSSVFANTGTGQEVDVEFEAWNATSGSTFISQIAIVGAQT
jgi:hypothetical protein